MEEQNMLKHSFFGVLSFILGLINVFGLFILLIVMATLELSIDGGIGSNQQIANAISLFYFSAIALALLTLVFGFFGAFQQNRKKLYAVFGIMFSFITLLISVFILIGELFLKGKFAFFPTL
jgi:hypothetical protein